jgi:hypothetical protein
LEKKWLSEKLKQELTEDYISGLQQLDRPDMMDDLYRIGEQCARDQVTPDDFPVGFDTAPKISAAPVLQAMAS